MKTIEANLTRSFAEVRKDIFFLQEEIEILKREFSKINTKKNKAK